MAIRKFLIKLLHRSAELFGSLILWRSFHFDRLHTLLYALYHESCWCCKLKFSSMLQCDHVRNIEILSKILFELTLFSHAIKLWTSNCTQIIWKNLGFYSFRFFLSWYLQIVNSKIFSSLCLLTFSDLHFISGSNLHFFIFSTRIYDDNWLKYLSIVMLSNLMKSIVNDGQHLIYRQISMEGAWLKTKFK